MSGQQIHRLLGLPGEPTPKKKAPAPELAPEPPATLEVELADQIAQRRLERETAQREAQLAEQRKLAALCALALDGELSHAVARAAARMWARADSDGIYRGSANAIGLAFGNSKRAGSKLVGNVVDAGWATRRPDGTYRMLGASSDGVLGTPGSWERQVPEVGTPGSRSGNPRFPPTSLRDVGAPRARSRRGAVPAPGRHPADRPAYEHPTSCTCDGTGWTEAPDQPGRLMRCEVRDA